MYAKRPFGGPEQVIRYLGRYTHRVGISNQHLVRMDDDGITFRTKEGKTVTLLPEPFLARFLQHVLPDGFVKIRHYGLMASGNATTKLELARGRLTSAAPALRCCAPDAPATGSRPSAPCPPGNIPIEPAEPTARLPRTGSVQPDDYATAHTRLGPPTVARAVSQSPPDFM
jgi:hypothetical protein